MFEGYYSGSKHVKKMIHHHIYTFLLQVTVVSDLIKSYVVEIYVCVHKP